MPKEILVTYQLDMIILIIHKLLQSVRFVLNQIIQLMLTGICLMITLYPRHQDTLEEAKV